jgi:hypothetical protein
VNISPKSYPFLDGVKLEVFSSKGFSASRRRRASLPLFLSFLLKKKCIEMRKWLAIKGEWG